MPRVAIKQLTTPSEAQGDVLYFDGSVWTRLPAGTAGQQLTTQGAGANPIWAATGGRLAFQAGRSGATAAGSFYRLINGMTMDSADNSTTFRGIPVPAGTLILVEWTRTDSDSATLEVLNNGSVIATVASAAAGVASSGTISIAVAAGLISFRNLSSGAVTSNVQITAVLEQA